MKFVCGCDSDDSYVRRYHPHIVKDAMGNDTLTSKHFNVMGQEICPIHGKTLAMDAIKKTGPQGNEITDYHAEYRARYGAGTRHTPGTPGIEDRRDNRDPVSVGKSALIERAHERAETNGSGEIAV